MSQIHSYAQYTHNTTERGLAQSLFLFVNPNKSMLMQRDSAYQLSQKPQILLETISDTLLQK